MQHAELEQYLPQRDVYTDLEELMRCRLLVQSIALSNFKNKSLQAGGHKSRDFGRGLEFEELRVYQSGDDIRTIDWRVTAKTGTTHTRLYTEEREVPVYCIVDQNPTMFFGSQRCLKSVMACHIAALLAWKTLLGGDRIGGMVFNQENITHISPKRNRKNLMRFLQSMCDYNAQLNTQVTPGNTPLEDALDQLIKTRPRGNRLFVISDFQAGFPQLEQRLNQLAAHNLITLIQINDPLELDENSGFAGSVSDGVKVQNLNRSSLKMLARQRLDQSNQIQSWCLARGMHYQQIINNESPLNWLGGLH